MLTDKEVILLTREANDFVGRTIAITSNYSCLVTLLGSPGSTTVFQNVPPDTYSPRVTATKGIEEAVVFWKVYVPARPTICSVNLINFGLVVNGTNLYSCGIPGGGAYHWVLVPTGQWPV